MENTELLQAIRTLIQEETAPLSQSMQVLEKKVEDQKTEILEKTAQLEKKVEDQRTEILEKTAQLEKKMEDQKTEILEKTAQLEKKVEDQKTTIIDSMKVLLETEVQSQINLVSEEIKNIREMQITSLKFEALEEKVLTLEGAIKVHSKEIQKLQKAQ